MPCGPCRGIDRRAFLEQVASLIGVAGLAACTADIQTMPAITPFTVSISSYPALAAAGGLAVVDSGSRSGTPIAVSRIDANTFVALSLVCPHQGVTVQLSGGGFYCPGHGAMFAAGGAWTGGQSTSSLSRYPLAYDAVAGTLTIG